MEVANGILQRLRCVAGRARDGWRKGGRKVGVSEQFSSPQFDPPLDAGIARFVAVLVSAGIETYESCEGGAGHCYPEPSVRFHGDSTEGMRAAAAAIRAGLPVAKLGRVWEVNNGELTGPTWEMVFSRKDGAA